MSDNFKALIVNQEGENFTREVKSIDKSFLKHGDVTVKVDYSDLNYKDGMILKNGGRLVKEFPHIPGIDFSGTVLESENQKFKTGDEIILTGWRVGEAFFGGYGQDPNKILDKTFGDVEGYDDMVVQKNVSVQSHCEHHMAPIIGIAHVAYIPNERVVGLSKLARVVEVFSKRLQTQERLTMQIAKTIMESLDAKGVAVTIDSTHQCMTMRGIKKETATTVTNYFLGQFKEDLSIQNRYLRFISK